MLNLIFWMKVQGKKHPGRLEIAERKLLSNKMLFKRISMVTSILVLVELWQTQLVKQQVAFNTETAHSPQTVL